MPLSDGGRDVTASLLTGSGTPFNEANAHLGVGTSNTAFARAQTDLLGTSERLPMDATYPQVVGNVITFRSTFGTGDANFAWEEWGVFNAVVAGEMLNRRVQPLGTKTGTEIWELTVTVTFDHPAP